MICDCGQWVHKAINGGGLLGRLSKCKQKVTSGRTKQCHTTHAPIEKHATVTAYRYKRMHLKHHTYWSLGGFQDRNLILSNFHETFALWARCLNRTVMVWDVTQYWAYIVTWLWRVQLMLATHSSQHSWDDHKEWKRERKILAQTIHRQHHPVFIPPRQRFRVDCDTKESFTTPILVL